MADSKIKDLTAKTTVVGTDEIVINDVAGGNVDKKEGLDDIKTFMSDSPTLVTPALGTPTSGTLTNCTGLPITGITSTTSAELAILLSDETGTSLAVFNTSPTLVTPLLGTPTSGVLTNCTGLPLTTGVTGVLPSANLDADTMHLGVAQTVSSVKTFSSAPVFNDNVKVAFGTGSDSTITDTGTAMILDFDEANAGSKSFDIQSDVTSIALFNNSGLTLTGNMAVTGTVDGVDIAAEETRLANTSGTNTGDEVAASTTTAGVVELLTTAELDTGTDTTRAATAAAIEGSARSTKLDGVEALADVTDTTNVNAAAATVVGTIATGVWQGTVVANAFLDADTAHLTTTQTFTGAKTFNENITMSTASIIGATDVETGTLSANDGSLAITITDSTGVSTFVSGTVLVAPVLGTPASGTMTNVTGTSGITGFGTLTQDVEFGGVNIQSGGVIFLKEQAEADADVAGEGQIWVDTQTPNKLFFTDDAGTDHDLTAGGGLSNIVEDTTPQLGGILDANGFDIQMDDTDHISFNGATATRKIEGSGGLDYHVPTGETHDIQINTDSKLRISASIMDLSAADFRIDTTKKLFLDTDDANTYIHEQSADDMELVVGGEIGLKLEEIGTEINVVSGAANALATNATNGFFYIPTQAGAPTGTPSAYTGKVAMTYDTTNEALYVYNGAWRSVTLA